VRSTDPRALLPGEFIEHAEQTGLIHPLTRHVIKTALRQCERWHERDTPLGVAVNLSMRNLGDPDFPDAVARLLDRFPLDPSTLLLELTESALIHDPRRAQTVLEQLRQLGVKLSLDDFGRGYTSLSFLSDLPLHQLKIDRSFITDLAHNAKHTAIARAIINLGHDLALEVVAEGVETAAANSLLKQLGCDLVQGYYYTPPLPPDELDTWLRQHRRIAAVA
jgi:EAL domain-containing protein (putative c-di-GMP-specific phosphodiesterase class I)